MFTPGHYERLQGRMSAEGVNAEARDESTPGEHELSQLGAAAGDGDDGVVRDGGEPREVELPEGGHGGEEELAGSVGDAGPAFREGEGHERRVGIGERREARVGDTGAFRDVELSERGPGFGSCFGPHFGPCFGPHFGPCFGPCFEGEDAEAFVRDGGAPSEDKRG